MASVLLTLRGKAPPRMESELSDAELAAIGRVTVLWAELEHLLLDVTAELAEFVGVPCPEDAFSFSFKKRLRAGKILAREALPEGEPKTWILGVFARIGALEQSRNRITHGLWEWLPADPARTRSFSDRKRMEFSEQFDFPKLVKLGHRIGEVVFMLRYPGGEEEFLQEHAQAAMQPGGVVSRSWLLMLAGKDPENPHLPLSNYLERIKTQPSLPPRPGVAKSHQEE